MKSSTLTDSPASIYLKQATAAAHRVTETAANSKAIMAGRIGPAEYRQLIQANYQVWATIEQALFPLVNDPVRKPGWSPYLLGFSAQLREDLAVCDVIRPPTPPRSDLDFSDEATILGALYVLNGSTLGGKYLYRALQSNEKLKEFGTFHFYRACSELSLGHWPAFQGYLNERLAESQVRQRAEAAARRVFAAFTHAYQTSS